MVYSTSTMEKNNHPIVFYFLALRKSKTFYGHNDYVCVCASIRLDHGQKVVTIDGHACRHYPLQKVVHDSEKASTVSRIILPSNNGASRASHRSKNNFYVTEKRRQRMYHGLT